jgi:hypothetical protein
MDWLERLPFYVMEGEGYVINNYGHPSVIRYIEGNRVLTLTYEYVDETAQRGRTLLFFRTYAIHVQVPTTMKWDDGTALHDTEVATVIDRICRTFEKHKKRFCRAVVNDKLYEQLARIDHDVKSRQQSSTSKKSPNRIDT